MGTFATIPTSCVTGEYANFSPDGRICRLHGFDGTKNQYVLECDIESGTLITNRTLSGLNQLFATEEHFGYAVSSDGRLLAICLATLGKGAISNPRIVIWNVDEDREVSHTPPSGTRSVLSWALDFSPDSRQIAVGRVDGSIELGDVDSMRVVGVLRGHSSGYFARTLQFSPDGTILASMGLFDGVGVSLDRLLLHVSRWTRTGGYGLCRRWLFLMWLLEAS